MIRFFTLAFLLFNLAFSTVWCFADDDKYDKLINNSVLYPGLFNYYWDESEDKIYLEIDQWKKEFLYLTFLAAGVGSNDIGLDRGQFGGSKVVRFERYGPKVLMIQANYDYRAESDNADEQLAVNEAFAQSVIAGFPVLAENKQKVLIDISDLLIRDAHDVIGTLKRTNQGSYSLDKNRSVIYHENLKNFPLNSEFEALLTFSGNPTGGYIRSVVPTPKSVTVRQRHSFVDLPDNNYKKRIFDPRAGYFGISYLDYATPIEEDIRKRFIARHRLEKKHPGRKISVPIEPIIYYLDRGTPEPIRSALIEGARWWNEAFEAAGFKDAFQVELLPEGVDPLDIRYNVIQWIHRSTRGWSYGMSITDPRTGEIIKGLVSLGSLRVRQDYLIAQGLLAPFEEGKPASKAMKDMALSRLRQLSAHEVGHTLGLSHNYIASTYNQGSVMDYPHPKIFLDKDDNIDLSRAYDTGIGAWDKVAIRYGYTQFNNQQDEKEELTKILQEGIANGIVFLSDRDARPSGSAHPKAHLWDNGQNAADELNRVMKVRAKALANFSEKNIPFGQPMASLEEVLIPVYFMHRYQVEAAAKIVGGIDYNYAIRGDGTFPTKRVDPKIQQSALDALLQTLAPSQLVLDERIISLIAPKPLGYWRGRESIETHTGSTFDPLAAAETSARMTLELLLDPQRCSRLIELHARDEDQPSLEYVLNFTSDFIARSDTNSDLEQEVKFIVQDLFLDEVISLARNNSTSPSVRALSRAFLQEQMKSISRDSKGLFLISKINKFFEEPVLIQPSKMLKPPDGSPIGYGETPYNTQQTQCTSIH